MLHNHSTVIYVFDDILTDKCNGVVSKTGRIFFTNLKNKKKKR